MQALQDYDSENSDSDTKDEKINEDFTAHLKPINISKTIVPFNPSNAAPLVVTKVNLHAPNVNKNKFSAL